MKAPVQDWSVIEYDIVSVMSASVEIAVMCAESPATAPSETVLASESESVGAWTGTSLASVIGFGELMHEGKTMSTYHLNPIVSYTVVALLFFLVISPFAFLVYHLENRFRK